MRLLLNAARREVATLGGDLTYYRDLERLSDEHLRMSLLPDGPGRQARMFTRKLAGWACRSWLPTPARRRLFVRSRVMPITSGEAQSTDVVLSHIWYPLQNWDLRKPVIWSSQGISPRRYYDYANRGRFNVDDVIHLYEVFGRDASALLIWTNAAAKRVVESCPFLSDKVEVIPPAVYGAEDDPERKPSTQDGVIRFLFLGDHAERKGLREACDGFARAIGSRSGARLTVVTNPPPDLQDRLKSNPAVRLLRSGAEVDVLQLMRESDVLVMPTKADTYGLAAVEAMARGCAVLISDLEPLPEVVPPGEVGFAVPVGDVAGLAQHMADLMLDEPLLRRLQEGARRLYLAKHSPAVFRSKLVRLTDKVLRHKADGVGLN